MASKKTLVIELLFNDAKRWSHGVGSVMINPVVTFDEVTDSISAYNAKHPAGPKLSTANPANFFKDFVRKGKSAEANWPASVLTAGYTGEQKKGAGACFEFVKLPAGQTTAFAVAAATYPKNPETTKLQVVQTLSVERLFKALARKDENWLQSLAVSIHIPHTHLALHPDSDIPLIHVGHMQSNMKLRKAEIDGLYMGMLNKGREVVLLTMEAKGDSDDILESQVIEQIEAIRSLDKVKSFLDEVGADIEKTRIIPMAMKLVDVSCIAAVPGGDTFGAAGRKLLYLADYGQLPYRGAKPSLLTPRAETMFDLRPAIKGISK
jgi:hypothetical protein